jgi:hypothetical protein
MYNCNKTCIYVNFLSIEQNAEEFETPSFNRNKVKNEMKMSLSLFFGLQYPPIRSGFCIIARGGNRTGRLGSGSGSDGLDRVNLTKNISESRVGFGQPDPGEIEFWVEY